MGLSCYVYIAGIHLVATYFFEYGYTLVRATNQCSFCQGYVKECQELMLLFSSALKEHFKDLRNGDTFLHISMHS